MCAVLLALCLIFRLHLLVAAGKRCKATEPSANGQALRDHTFKTSVVSGPIDCQVLCERERACQSYNYFIPGKLCELNNRTKEARPPDFGTDGDRFYMKKWYTRVPLGSILEVPAENCAEIYASEEGNAVSGNYWLKLETVGIFQVYCGMTRDKEPWTLIARFSNTDTRHWMNDSGYWWYDKTEAAGETTDPTIKADMISPAFWLVSGNEFKITRSDDSQHTALLQTTGDCLGGQTFRSKITSYGDFRNGNVWAWGQCQGSCTVQYGGLFNTTTGFQRAGCNGAIQSSHKVGFWCNNGWSSSVMMIGGGGSECHGAGHGLAVTGAKSPHLITEDGRPEKDFADLEWHNANQAYALNLWIRKN